MSREQLLQQYDDIYEAISEDKDLMLRVLVEIFGDVESLWDVVHTHVTGIHEAKLLDDCELANQVEHVVYAYREIIDQIVEEELL